MKWLFLFFILLSNFVWAFEPGKVYQWSARQLRPTQATVGMTEVHKKSKKLKKMSTEGRHQFLKSRPVPVIVGPGNELFLIDRHHMSRALLDSGHHRHYVVIQDDLSHLAEKEFWSQMQKLQFTYLRDHKDRPIDPSQLPLHIQDLRDDPYRSLAYFARIQGAYAKSNEPFSEFQWARYFRQHITENEIKADFEKAVKKAVVFSSLPGASALPGFISVRMSCLRVYY